MTPKKIKTKKNKKKILFTVLGVLLGLILALFLAAYFIFKHYYGLLDYHHAEQEEWETLAPEELKEPDAPENGSDENAGNAEDMISDEELSEIEKELLENLESMQEVSDLNTDSFNILLVGVDAREDKFAGRSDAMILLSVNKEMKTLTLTSFLRDIYCAIPEHGSNRLNAAFAFGGPKLLKSTLQGNFGISADRYVVVNFTSVRDFIDAIGGVDIEISKEEIQVMNSYIAGQNKLWGNEKDTDIIPEDNAGSNHLNGNQALAYARVRYVGTDFARTGRQRTIINLAFEKVKKMSIPEMTDLLEKFLPKVRTDLTEGDFASLLFLMLDISAYSMDTMTIPMEGTWTSTNIRGMSVLTIDFKKNADAWYEKVEGEK